MKPILLDFPEKFVTERLLISIYENGDGAEFYHLLQANYAHLQEELSEIQELNSIEDAEAYIRSKKVEWLTRKRLVPKIVKRSTGQMIGQLWIEPRWERRIFEIGYFVEASSEGKGYITEAVQRISTFLFTELEARKLEILTKITNIKSIGVAKRCGFQQEAQLRERSCTRAGEAVDLLCFGLLRREFENRSSKMIKL
jgi:ribosomal-protein-serine acetyltransferase